MKPAAALVAALAIAAILAGCQGRGSPCGLDGDDCPPDSPEAWALAQFLDHRGVVQARLPNGTWQAVDDWPAQDIPVFWMNQSLALEEALAPTPMGGGGQEVPVALGGALTVTLRVIPASLAPGGSVQWVRVDTSGFFDPAEDPYVPLGTTGLEEPFDVVLDGPGVTPFAVKVYDASGRAAFYSFTTEDVHAGAAWTFAGQVQPQHPRDGVGPLVQPPMMADRFLLGEWAYGLELHANLTYRGVWAPGMGADLNLALYDAAQEELQCSQHDGVGPAATAEGLMVPLRPGFSTEERTFEAWVGYTPGFFCGPKFGEGYYTNPTSVPYRLRLEVWPKPPAFLAKQT